TLPGTHATDGLLDAEAFAALADAVTLVNVGRGTVIDETALWDALESGKVAFAALDVFAPEPLPPTSPLWEHPRVLVSPHTAALTPTENSASRSCSRATRRRSSTAEHRRTSSTRTISTDHDVRARRVPPGGGAMADFSKVLIANRGEIAVRVIRAARDEGLATVAVHADPDRPSEHVRQADEAFSLGGSCAQESYLVAAQILEAAPRPGAEAVHPGSGFFCESAEVAEAGIDGGLGWIGPRPSGSRILGDKVSPRDHAQRAGGPLGPGGGRPVEDAAEVERFAREHG